MLKGSWVAIAIVCLCELACSRGIGDKVAAAVEVDHVYIYAPASGSEGDVARALTSAGLALEPERKDFGDGVVGRYARFENAYLELLWYDGKTPTDADTRRRHRVSSIGRGR